MKYLDIVNDKNNEIGEIKSIDEVFKQGLWHREVSVFIVNNQGKVLLQKRPETKERKPNMWSVCSGFVAQGEDIIAAAIRKLLNELIITVTIHDLELIEIAIENETLNNEINNNFRYIYLLKTNRKIEDFKYNPEEVSELKFVSIEELNKIIINRDKDVTFSKQQYMDVVIKQIEEKTK